MSEPRPLQSPAPTARSAIEAQLIHPQTESLPLAQPTHALQWMQQMIEQQARLFEMAQKEQALTLAELKRIAQTVCQEAWDARLRAGENPEGWPPPRIATLIIQSIQSEVRLVRLARDPDLAVKHQQLQSAFSQAQMENRTLKQRLEMLEQNLPRAKPLTGRDAKRAALEEVSLPPADKAPPVARGLAVGPGHPATQDLAISAISQPPQVGSGISRVDDVVRLIATRGLCRWKDIRDRLARQWEVKPSAGTIDTVFKKAIDLDLLQIKEVRLEWGGKPTGKMLLLTETGQACARALGLEPVESQYTRGLAVHKDAAHFYAILEVAAILTRYYQNVDVYPRALALEDGNYFADLTAWTMEGERLCVEVERGTYKDELEREGKWLRAATANQGVIYLVTPNQDTLNSIIQEIDAIRGCHPERKMRIKAFNVRSYRERPEDSAEPPWSFDG